MQTEHGQIVKLRRAADEGIRRLVYMRKQRLRRIAAETVEDVERPLHAEKLSLFVGRLRQTVGIEKQPGAALQLQLIIVIADALHPADHKAVLVPDDLILAARLHQDGVFVAGVGCRQHAGLQIEHAQPHCDEHLLAVVAADLGVDRLEDLVRAAAGHGAGLQQDLRGHHEQRRGDALAGYVGHDKAEMILVDQEKVVKVAADLLGRIHAGVDVQLRPLGEGRKDVRQHVGLDAVGERQLDVHALLFGRDGGKVLFVFGQIPLHIRHHEAQVFHLVAGADVQKGEVVGPADAAAPVGGIALRRVGDLIDRADERALHMARDQITDQKDHDEQRQHILQHKSVHPVREVRQRQIGQQKAADLAAHVVDRDAGGAQPAVFFGP